MVIEKSTIGHVMAVNASGKIAEFQCWHGFALMTALPVSLISFWLTKSIWSVGVGFLFSICFCSISEAIVARKIVRMSLKYWIMRIVIPTIGSAFFTIIVGWIPSAYMEKSLGRIILTTFVSLLVYLPCVWYVLLSSKERCFCKNKILKMQFLL